MEKIAIERIVDNFKNEVEMSNFMFTTPNEIDENGEYYEFTSNIIYNLVVKEKSDEKYNQIFKDNYQYVVNLKNTKNHLVLNFITKSTELDRGFISEIIEIDKIDDGTSCWKSLDYILRNSYICYVECRKKNHQSAYLME